MRSPRTSKLHLPSRVAQICWFTSQPWVRDVPQRRTSRTSNLSGDGSQSLDLRSQRRQRHAGFCYRPETSSATISAAGRGCLASATLCPAHMESASMSPVVPTIGGAGS